MRLELGDKRSPTPARGRQTTLAFYYRESEISPLICLIPV